jgi:hypothetical protein
MNVLSRSGPLQRAASRLAHALSLLWLTSSAPAPFAATGVVPVPFADGGEALAEVAVSAKEKSDERDA